MDKSFIILLFVLAAVTCRSQSTTGSFHVKGTDDFELSRNGTSKAWETTNWLQMPVTEGDDKRQTKVKALYSSTGIYFLFHNQDRILTASKTADFDRLWLEDVNEIFLWTDTTQTIYFEYEISPLNVELPILVPNVNTRFLGWLPWEYSGDRKTRHMTSVGDAEKKNGSAIKEWYAEIFIPYKLLAPLGNVPPKSGTSWRANFYRIDYDDHQSIEWSWKRTEKTFHEFRKFGTLIFD